MTVIDPQEPFSLRTNEWLLPQVQQPAGVAVGSSDANGQCPRRALDRTPLHLAALTNQPVVINTLLAAGTDVKSDVRDAKTPLDLLIQVLSEFEK